MHYSSYSYFANKEATMSEQASIDYYEVVVCCARHVDDPQITFKRLRKVIHLIKTKYPNLPELDEAKLRREWRRFKRS